MKEIELKKKVRRIPFRIEGYGWHITIDDGFCAYRYPLKASLNYSIESLYKKINKSIKKERIKTRRRKKNESKKI